MDRELVDWFQPYDEGDMPELHLVGLTAEEVVRCFDVIAACGPRWSDRTFHIDAKGVDVTVPERPDVARLVVDGRASHACIGAKGITVDGVELPQLDWFIFRDELQFFWTPGTAWNEQRVGAFFALVKRLLGVAPSARVLADPRYPPRARQKYDALIRRALEDA